MNKRQGVERSVQLTLYFLASCCVLMGVIFLLGPGGNVGTSLTLNLLMISSGSLLLILLAFRPAIARYFTVGFILVICTISASHFPLGLTPLGFAIAIGAAGLLIDGRVIWPTTLLSLFGYIGVITLTQGLADVASTFAVAMGLAVMGAIMSAFSTSQRRAVRDAQTQSQQRDIALNELLAKQQLEQQVGSAIVGVMDHLRQIVMSQSGAVSEQVSALAQVTSTVEELAQSALQIAASAREVGQHAEQALGAAGRSQQAVQQSLTEMLQIKSQVNKIVERTLKLNEGITRISEVTSVVSTIAAQTHLLALNASIEAAGAGGERFATVAAEVKKLASRSQAEATQIKDLVAEVQRANSASVMATEEGLKDADKGATQTRAAAEANFEVIEVVGATTERAQAITMSTAQQRSAAEQVVDTMHHLSEVATEVANTTRAIEQSVNELAALAQQLGALIGERSEMITPQSISKMRGPALPSDVAAPLLMGVAGA